MLTLPDSSVTIQQSVTSWIWWDGYSPLTDEQLQVRRLFPFLNRKILYKGEKILEIKIIVNLQF